MLHRKDYAGLLINQKWEIVSIACFSHLRYCGQSDNASVVKLIWPFAVGTRSYQRLFRDIYGFSAILITIPRSLSLFLPSFYECSQNVFSVKYDARVNPNYVVQKYPKFFRTKKVFARSRPLFLTFSEISSNPNPRKIGQYYLFFVFDKFFLKFQNCVKTLRDFHSNIENFPPTNRSTISISQIKFLFFVSAPFYHATFNCIDPLSSSTRE